MNLLGVLRMLVNRLPDHWAEDDERLREAEQRVDTLATTLGAQRAQRTRDDYARLEMLGVSRQILEERIEAEAQERRRTRGEGDHVGTG